MTYHNIPDELKSLPQWVTWKTVVRNGKKTKVPYQPRPGKKRLADSTNPETWGTFTEATSLIDFNPSAFDGIGFVFTRNDPYIGFDIDDTNREEFNSLIDTMDSYTEISPSGDGLHIIGRGSLPVDNSGKHPQGLGIFQHSRYFTMTGNVLDGAIRPVRDVQPVIDTHWDAWFTKTSPEPSFVSTEPGYYDEPPPVWTGGDDEIIEKLHNESNPSKFLALWAGDTIDYDNDDSAADLALCSKIAFYTQDPEQISRIFARSGLMRDKWNRADYQHATITKALQRSETYTPEPGVIPFDANGSTPRLLPRTDTGNAERLAKRFSGDIHYCHQWDTWLIWDGTRFRRDDSGEIFRKAKIVVRSIYDEAKTVTNEKLREAITNHAKQSEALSRIKAMIDLARHEPSIAVSSDDLDSHPNLLNIANGVLDLSTGNLLPHDPKYLFTRKAPVTFDPDAICPAWITFLNRIMDNNGDLIAFIQRAIGYSMTASVAEQAMFILHGNGQNGKSTLLNTIDHILGDYRQTIPVERLMMKYGDNGIANDLARLPGVRFARSSETTEGKRLDEAMVKVLTSDDPIPVRMLHKEFFDLKPQFKIWMATNHKPTIRGTDKGIWRRMRLIPFSVQIPDEERDMTLDHKLRAEASGILNWMIAGCLAWQQHGLSTPPNVTSATSEYRADMDVFGRFVEECCTIAPETFDLASNLYATYRAWCNENGEYQMTKTAFGRKLSELGFYQKQHHLGTKGRSWIGIAVSSDANIATNSRISIFPTHSWG
jgi:putative DNA primase/helicase